MYEIRCPECHKTMKSPFVRRGAVADCSHCGVRFRVGSEHIQRMMLVMDPVAEGELASAGAAFGGVEAGKSGGNPTRRSISASAPGATRRGRFRDLPREVVVMWSSIAAGVVCLLLLVVLVVNLVGSGNRGATANDRIAQPLPDTGAAGRRPERTNRGPSLSGNGIESHEVKTHQDRLPPDDPNDSGMNDSGQPVDEDFPGSEGGRDADPDTTNQNPPAEPIENGSGPVVNGEREPAPIRPPPPPLPGLPQPRGG